MRCYLFTGFICKVRHKTMKAINNSKHLFQNKSITTWNPQTCRLMIEARHWLGMSLPEHGSYGTDRCPEGQRALWVRSDLKKSERRPLGVRSLSSTPSCLFSSCHRRGAAKSCFRSLARTSFSFFLLKPFVHTGHPLPKPSLGLPGTPGTNMGES